MVKNWPASAGVTGSSVVREDCTCRKAAQSTRHNYRAQARASVLQLPQPAARRARAAQQGELRPASRERPLPAAAGESLRPGAQPQRGSGSVFSLRFFWLLKVQSRLLIRDLSSSSEEAFIAISVPPRRALAASCTFWNVVLLFSFAPSISSFLCDFFDSLVG